MKQQENGMRYDQDRADTSQIQVFAWKDRQYYYSPYHHKIFSDSDISAFPSQPTVTFPNDVHIRAIYLNISEGCNLNCKYCFTPPPEAGRSMKMSKDTARAAIIKLAKWWQSKSVNTPARITFFGGEPLLNRDVLEYSIHFSHEWGREFRIPFSYAVATNATLLTNNDIDLFKRERVFLWVSIDGPADIHDRSRRFRNGSGSHAIAIDHALSALHRMGTDRVGVRATVSTELSGVIEYLAGLGFRRISTKPVDVNQEKHASLQQYDLHTLAKNIDECSTVLLRWRPLGLKCFPVDQDIASLRVGPSGHFVCAAGSGSLTVDANGWIYPCHRFIGNSHYKLGHVREKNINMEPCKEFAALDISRLQECSHCWTRKFCLGCCPGASVAAGNAPGRPNPQTCEERKLYTLISLKCAVAEGLVW